jgi:hypothetical protein
MNFFIPCSITPFLCLTWLYALLIIVQLVSTSVHVVSPWYVKTLEASILPTLAAMSTSGITSGSRSISDADGDSHRCSRCDTRASIWCRRSPLFRDACWNHPAASLIGSAYASHTPHMWSVEFCSLLEYLSPVILHVFEVLHFTLFPYELGDHWC